MPASWPLVGRDEELEMVADAVRRNEAGGVVLSGASGVGKTRLASEVVDLARRQGRDVEWAVATRAASTVAFGALADLLPPSRRARQSRTEMLLEVCRSLSKRGGDDPPVILGVDDAHLLDHASAAVLLHAASTRSAFVLATVRTGDRAPDSVTALWKDGLAERLELQPLGSGDIDLLISGALPGQVGAPARRTLHRLSGGNILFLRELIQSGLDTGSLTVEHGMWTWRGPFATPRLAELVDSRLGRLEAGERSALEVLAAAEPVPLATALALLAPAAIASLERKALVVAVEEGRRSVLRLAHPLYGEVIRARTPSVRAAEIRRRLARTEERWGARRRGDHLRIATWRLDARDPDLGPGLLLEASREAAALSDHTLAERLARAAVGAGAEAPGELALADALHVQGRVSEAEEVYGGLGDRMTTESERSRAARRRAMNLFYWLGDLAEAREVLAAAERSLTEPPIRDEIAATRAMFAVMEGDISGPPYVARQVLARPGVTVTGRLLALTAQVTAASVPGPVGLAIDLARGLLAELTPESAAEAPEARFAAESSLAHSLIDSGRLDEAESMAEGAREAAVTGAGAPTEVAHWTFAVGHVLFARGRVASAATRFGEAAAIARQAGSGTSPPWFLSLEAIAAAQAGDVALAERALAEARAAVVPGLRLYQADLARAEAWVELCRGQGTAAVDRLLQVASELMGWEANLLALFVLHDACRMGGARRAAEPLAEVAGKIGGAAAAAMSRHAAALRAGDGAALDEAAASFLAMGFLLLAAEASAEAASAHRAAGLRSRAAASASISAGLAGRCEGARTPSLALAGGAPLLTAREREIALLAASGLSSRGIAERLSLSVRTVDNHLRQVYDKFDISRRSQLGAALGLTQGASSA